MALRVWLPLTGTLENKGISAVTATTFETPTYVAGKIGQCYQRANSNSQLTNGINLNSNLMDILGTQASIAVWVKPLGTHTHYNGTIASSGNWNAKKWAFGVSQDNSKVDVLCGGYNTYITCAVPVNQWTHLTSTFDNGTCKLYKNGEYVGQLTGQKAFETDATNACIARETYASGYFGFNGCVNDVRIYDHCLSAAEVHEISQGLVLHYKLDSIPYNFSTNNVTTFTDCTIGQWYYTIFSISMTNFIAQTGAANGDKFTFSVDINAASNTKNLAARVQHFNSSSDRTSVIGNYITPGSSGRSSITFTINTAYTRLDFMINNGDSGSVTANSTEQYKCTRIEKGDVHTGYIQTGITPYIQDSSGYGHNGTPAFIDRFSMTSDTPRYNASTVFSGSNSRIGSSKDLYFDKNYGTVACWFNYAENSSASHWLFAINSGNGGASDCAFGLYSNSNKFYFCAAGNTKTKSFADEDVVNKWNHAAITYNNGIGKCYLNGILFYTATDLTQLTDRVGFCIGGRLGTSSYTFNGMISDVRVYCTPLSDDDIKQLYNTAAKVDNLHNMHTFEYIENSPEIKLTKQGQFKEGEIQEDTVTKFYKTNKIIKAKQFIEK